MSKYRLCFFFFHSILIRPVVYLMGMIMLRGYSTNDERAAQMKKREIKSSRISTNENGKKKKQLNNDVHGLRHLMKKTL
jgi:hypothetical protein